MFKFLAMDFADSVCKASINLFWINSILSSGTSLDANMVYHAGRPTSYPSSFIVGVSGRDGTLSSEHTAKALVCPALTVAPIVLGTDAPISVSYTHLTLP